MDIIFDPHKVADTIPNCARHLGLARATFYREWISTGRVTPVDLGGRGLSILLDDLRAAVTARAAEQAADPTKRKLRNVGAQRVAARRAAAAAPAKKGKR